MKTEQEQEKEQEYIERIEAMMRVRSGASFEMARIVKRLFQGEFTGFFSSFDSENREAILHFFAKQIKAEMDCEQFRGLMQTATELIPWEDEKKAL
jgi:hypothetical protein